MNRRVKSEGSAPGNAPLQRRPTMRSTARPHTTDTRMTASTSASSSLTSGTIMATTTVPPSLPTDTSVTASTSACNASGTWMWMPTTTASPSHTTDTRTTASTSASSLLASGTTAMTMPSPSYITDTRAMQMMPLVADRKTMPRSTVQQHIKKRINNAVRRAVSRERQINRKKNVAGMYVQPTYIPMMFTASDRGFAPPVAGYIPAPPIAGYVPAPPATGYVPAPPTAGYIPAPPAPAYFRAPTAAGYVPAGYMPSYF